MHRRCGGERPVPFAPTYRFHVLLTAVWLDYDNNRVFGHREGAYVASF